MSKEYISSLLDNGQLSIALPEPYKINEKQNSKYRRKSYAYIPRPLLIYALIRIPCSSTDICPNPVLCQDHLTWYATLCGDEGISYSA